MGDRRADRLEGIAAPLSPGGVAAAYGPAPWRFAGRSLTVVADCNPDAVAALTPAPLEPVSARVRFSVHRLICDIGFGWAFAQANPERCQFHEAVVGIAVRHGRSTGYWDPFLWCDGEAEIAVGREMYGWPQREGRLSLTEPHPQVGVWRPGDRVVGKVSRFHEAAMTLSVAVEQPGDLEIDLPAFVTFFTERALPDPRTGTVLRQLFASEMEGVAVDHLLSGPATLDLAAPELRALAPFTVLGGRVNTVSWTKNRSRLVAEREVDAAGRPSGDRG